MIITVDDARRYFRHDTQQKASLIEPDNLPDVGVLYYADAGVCACFHEAHWPGVFMAHYAVDPGVWGKTTRPARKILNEFWRDHNPEAIIGWTPESNRAALSFARRLGFKEYGRLELSDVTVIKQEWKPWV